jgi:hypothetical protein
MNGQSISVKERRFPSFGFRIEIDPETNLESERAWRYHSLDPKCSTHGTGGTLPGSPVGPKLHGDKVIDPTMFFDAAGFDDLCTGVKPEP